MSHEAGFKSGEEKLIYMANQIATFFQTMPHAEAVEGVADHINKFWEPRMRRHFFEIVERGGGALKPLVLEAAGKVNRPAEEKT
ncbi:formate dehydrogenase subunit delta [Chelativorans sp.]|uniref:formate dehydrogenase subunit delta n=1 Tax=Chelativorans sp. TaxID=2203393 RepID=UPI0028127C65|nr:formate dehydrogenase subunit delta [Chelativorans sp.]